MNLKQSSIRARMLIIVLFISINSFACDGCNVYVNFSPIDYKNRISIIGRTRMMYGTYNMFGTQILTKHASHGNDPLFWNNDVQENYNTLELRGAFYVREVWKTTVIVPFVNNHQLIGNLSRYEINGIADPIVIETYQVFNSLKSNDSNRFKHRLEIGGGVKFPLGKIDKRYENGIPNLDLQPGTGSLDFISSVSYMTRIKKYGAILNANIKLNSYNRDDYKYGNTFNSTINLFRQTTMGNFTFMPLVGGYFEFMSLDKSRYESNGNSVVIDYNDTGGAILFGTIGSKVFYKTLSLFIDYQHRVYSKLNGYTQLLTKNRINVGLTYSL